MQCEHERRAAKRLAIQIAVQLPDDPEAALAVLRETEKLVRGFLMDKPAKGSRRRKPCLSVVSSSGAA
jgi:hypothetical protein